MADLTGQTPAATYKGLLQVNDYADGIAGNTGSSALAIQDGAGNATALAISTDNVGIGVTDPSEELSVLGDIKIIKNLSGDPSNGDILGSVGFEGVSSANTNLQAEAKIEAVAEEDHTGTSAATGLQFYTKKSGIGPGSQASPSMRIDSDGNVGIGTTSPSAILDVVDDNIAGYIFKASDSGGTRFAVASGGNVGIGTSPEINKKLHIKHTEDANFKLERNKVGDTNTQNGYVQISAEESRNLIYSKDLNGNNKDCVIDAGNVTPGTDDVQDLGSASLRWDDIYATNTTIQSSDRELKQDIEELSEAETRVAQACKGLLRKYRWKSSVEEKGDEARIHFGIMAQDLEAAFAAEGLDAGRYGMFVKNTWWTADRVIPAVEAMEAVEAVYDEEGNEVSPAVEAVEAQPEKTVTDIFNNSEDAPEGATEVTQRGVRYSELLAFIIAAI